MTFVAVLIILFGAWPIISVILSSVIADSLHCQVDEGSAHACLYQGRDIGDTLNFMFVSGWFAFLTVPLALGALIVWSIVAFVTRSRSRR